MYKFMGDESGLQGDQEKVCVVTGFVGTCDQWDDFTAEWDRVLCSFGVAEFHGLEFWDWYLDENKHEVIRAGPYKGWTDKDDFEFIDKLLSVIEGAKLSMAGTGIVIQYFFELTEDERRWLTTAALYGKDWPGRGKPNDPWFAAFQSTILNAADRVPLGERLFPVFDIRNPLDQRKQPEHDKARQLYAEMLDQQPPLKARSKLGESLAFGTRTEHKGLQAADLLANRSRVYVVEGFGSGELAERLRLFLENGSGWTKMLNVRGLDLLLRGCPFRGTFWKTEDFKTAVPDYLEQMRRAGINVLAYKGSRSGHYYSHHIKVGKVRRLKRIGVSGNLVYIASPDESIQQAKDQQGDKES